MPIAREKLRSFLEAELGLESEDYADDSALFSDGLLDSFSMVDLIQYIETETGARMQPGDVSFDNLDSVERILAWAATADGADG